MLVDLYLLILTSHFIFNPLNNMMENSTSIDSLWLRSYASSISCDNYSWLKVGREVNA